MTQKQKEQLAELLTLAAEESEPPSPDEPRGRPAGFIPEICLKPFFKQLSTTPFVELIIYRRATDGQFEYLYQDRHDEWWDGFCAIGGMVRREHPAAPVEVVQCIIDREFKGEGITVCSLQVVSFLNWQVHPWCNPFAVTCVVKVNEKIEKRNNRRWLRIDDLPHQMVPNHKEYLYQCERFLKDGALTFTPYDPYGVGVMYE